MPLLLQKLLLLGCVGGGQARWSVLLLRGLCVMWLLLQSLLLLLLWLQRRLRGILRCVLGYRHTCTFLYISPPTL